eukprot:Anaeramoba_flamelloidesc41098_g1_i2.p1 GENE.c41098_g1_i2~~c41098_g1_i2.p1  ORF type:complete len:168 (+),score=46.05 c41098_g1_i2:12-515(+)
MSSKKKDFSPNTKLKVNSKVNIPDLLSVALLNLSQPDFESLTVEATGSAICRAVDLSEAIKQSKPKVGYKVVIKSIKLQKNNYSSYSKKRSIISLIQIIFSGERIPKKILKKKQNKKEKEKKNEFKKKNIHNKKKKGQREGLNKKKVKKIKKKTIFDARIFSRRRKK